MKKKIGSLLTVTLIYAVVFFILIPIVVANLPDMKYENVVISAILISVAIMMVLDFILDVFGIDNNLSYGIKIYKVVLLGTAAVFSFWGGVVLIPGGENALKMRSNAVLIISLLTFQEALKKHFSLPDKRILSPKAKKVMKALKEESCRPVNVVDYMNNVNPNILNMSEEDFSSALYELTQKGKIDGVNFDPEMPNKALMWDDVSIIDEK